MASYKHTTATQLLLPILYAEEWRAVIGYEGLYEVSTLGRVRSIDRQEVCRKRWGIVLRLRRGRLLCLTCQKGYLYAHLCKEGVATNLVVHRLVLEAFIGPRPDGFVGNHIDAHPTNNALYNLEWVTQQTNIQHAVAKGTHSSVNSVTAVLTAQQVHSIRRQLKEGMRQKDLAVALGVSRGTISAIARRRNWKHLL